MVVWAQEEGLVTSIWASWYDTRLGSWGAATPIENDDVHTASVPCLAMDGAGNAVAVWTQTDGTFDSVWSNRFE